MFITMAVACRPLSHYWGQYLGDTNGTCINVSLFYLVFGIINMVIDVVILLSPIPRIITLQLNKRKKVSVIGIMLLGSLYVDIFALCPDLPRLFTLRTDLERYLHSRLIFHSVCVASMFRIYYLDQLAGSVDATWWMGPGSKWFP